MAKSTSKRALHKRDMEKFNKTALIMGGIVALILLGIIVFFLL